MFPNAPATWRCSASSLKRMRSMSPTAARDSLSRLDVATMSRLHGTCQVVRWRGRREVGRRPAHIVVQRACAHKTRRSRMSKRGGGVGGGELKQRLSSTASKPVARLTLPPPAARTASNAKSSSWSPATSSTASWQVLSSCSHTGDGTVIASFCHSAAACYRRTMARARFRWNT
jgi:hypothetical protein